MMMMISIIPFLQWTQPSPPKTEKSWPNPTRVSTQPMDSSGVWSCKSNALTITQSSLCGLTVDPLADAAVPV